MRAVILAAGLGTRLEPLTLGRSKGMISVANKPLLHWIASGFGDAIIVARRDQTDILEHFSGREIVFQEEPKGTADALLSAKGSVDGDFVVVNGDDLFSGEDIRKFVGSKGCGIAVSKHETPEMFGSVETEGEKISKILEKHPSGKGMVNCGMYRLDERIFKYLKKIDPSGRGEYELTDSINLAVKDGVYFDAVEVEGWQTVSHPWDILDANAKVLQETGSIISESAEIRPGAFIEDPVAIGGNTVIGPNCYIRKFSSIGAGCRIGNAVEIKNSVIMENSHVSHLSYVGDSVIGKNCNIGAGTIFANLRLDDGEVSMGIKGEKVLTGRRKLGSIIGDNVKIGVNVTLMPGRKIWPGMMVPPCFLVKEDMAKQPSLRL
ncbi:MAG: NTP transferase domain-containing protein [Candidatus Aenigmarchaeota archaeon]|nr:NTP transferase domain-containing protein [Candidatus Aenigmarchaeota archaeon]